LSEKAAPLLIVVSAPSGAGKTTLCDRLLAARDDIVYSVSCTTRAPRGEETNGREYYFLSEEEFDRYVEKGCFLEHAVVHGHRYGTLKETVRAAMSSGRHVLLDIDVQGAAQIRDAVAALPADDVMRAGFVDIFVAPPSMDALEKRLVGRGEDGADVIEERMVNARREMARAPEYRHLIVNDDLDEAFRRLTEIVERESRDEVERGLRPRGPAKVA